MLESCTKKYSDESDEKGFHFIFYCDSCGQSFKALPVSFTGGEIPPQHEEQETELWKLRWQKEHALAFARANSQAENFFFSCPGCGDYICLDCTVSERTASGEIRDRCRRCHERSRKKMQPLRMLTQDKGRANEG